MKAWLVPIRSQYPAERNVAHYFSNTRATNKLVRTACGREVNPGFAVKPTSDTRRCKHCERKEHE